jgi:DNA-binding GntR family transcriptional regulator
MERSEIHRLSVADQVAVILRQRILDGELRPGTQLQELRLASSLGVSRNTMREAMRILSLEGLLRRSPHRGVAVAQLTPRDLREIYHLRRMLEIPAVLAASNRDEDVLKDLLAALEQYEAAVRAKHWMTAVRFDFQFHTLLMRFHHNQRLESFYQNVLRELRMGMVLVDRRHDDPGVLVPIHRKIYELLSARKLKECASALERHLDDSESRLSRLVDGQVPTAVRKRQRQDSSNKVRVRASDRSK